MAARQYGSMREKAAAYMFNRVATRLVQPSLIEPINSALDAAQATKEDKQRELEWN